MTDWAGVDFRRWDCSLREVRDALNENLGCVNLRAHFAIL